MDPRYERLRAALRDLGDIPLREPPEGWEEYALHQRAACVATHAARLEAVAERDAALKQIEEMKPRLARVERYVASKRPKGGGNR